MEYGNGTGTRACVDLDKFIDYVQKEYRSNLNRLDYEILEDIAKTYSREEIIKALNYCRSKSSDSLMYLKDALIRKYYESKEIINKPEWMDKEIKEETLSEEDIIFFKNFWYQFCDSKEEAEERILANGWSI